MLSIVFLNYCTVKLSRYVSDTDITSSCSENSSFEELADLPLNDPRDNDDEMENLRGDGEAPPLTSNSEEVEVITSSRGRPRRRPAYLKDFV